MNAYELAKYLEDDFQIQEAVIDMLREQADRIAELEETIGACYAVQKMQAEEVYKGNDRIAELEKQLEEKNKPPTKFDTLMESQMNGYWCIYCMKFLPNIDGVIVHDDIVHPDDMTFDEEPKQ